MGSAAQRKLKRMIRFIEKWPKSHDDGEDDEEDEYNEYDACDEYNEFDEGMVRMMRGWWIRMGMSAICTALYVFAWAPGLLVLLVDKFLHLLNLVDIVL